jgi:hypothetical protein
MGNIDEVMISEEQDISILNDILIQWQQTSTHNNVAIFNTMISERDFCHIKPQFNILNDMLTYWPKVSANNDVDIISTMISDIASCGLEQQYNTQNDRNYLDRYEDIYNNYKNGILGNVIPILNAINTDSDTSLLNNLSIITRYIEIEKEYAELNQRSSIALNVFNWFDIYETKHSYIISKFLNPNAEHGQNNLFLKIFLEMLGIAEPDKGKWVITVEKGKIDILLKRVEPRSVVIIENKSNYAIDQVNQIYRYWHSEIYYPIRHNPHLYNDKNYYRVLYLPPDGSKMPEMQTMLRPQNGFDNSPTYVPWDEILQVWTYDKEIIDWLKTSLDKLNQLPDRNVRLTEIVSQYINYWE